jgi:hypothetical protein
LTICSKFTFGIATLCVWPAAGFAGVYNVQLNSAQFGAVKQSDVPASNGSSGANSCTPTATANAFAYLQNQFSGAYGGSLVSGGSYGNIQATATALATTTYMRTTSSAGTTAGNWVGGEYKYLETMAPDQTIYGGMGNFFDVSTDTYPWFIHSAPTFNFLFNALEDDAGVELGMFSSVGGIGHVLSLTGLNWNDDNEDGFIDHSENATMTFVDPLDGAVHSSVIWQVSNNGVMHTDYYLPGQDSGTLVLATSEIASVPEPGGLAIGALGLLGLLFWRGRGGMVRQ